MVSILTQAAVLDPFTGGGFAAMTRSFTTVLIAGIVVLLLIMVVYHLVAAARARRREGLRKKIMDAVGRAAKASAAGESAEAAIGDPESLFNRSGIVVLTKVFDTMNKDGRAALKDLLLQVGADQYIRKQLDTPNEDYLVELMRMVGDLELAGLEKNITELLYAHRDNIELQYQGFLALSKLGSGEDIVKICMDEKFVQTLSFRSLQQIFNSYTGDIQALVAQLLNSPDHYVVRACIKRIGAGGLKALAPDVTTWLDSEDRNLVIDAVRALGQLEYEPAAPRMVALLKDNSWEIRAAAVTALGSIDREGHVDELVAALQDSEWQVRYNAGLVLQSSPQMEKIRKMVLDSGDQFALDMLEYVTQSGAVWRKAE